MKRRFLLFGSFSSFLAGVALISLFSIPVAGIVGTGCVFGMLCVQKARFFPLFLWTIFFVLGMLRATYIPFLPPSGDIGNFATNDGISVEITGMLSSPPDIRFSQEKWILTAESLRLSPEEDVQLTRGKVLLSIPRRGAEIEVGQRIRAHGMLKTPFEFPDFSYRTFLAKDGIFSVMSRPNITPLERNPFSGMRLLYSLRTSFLNILQKHVPPPESALAAGILIGDRSGFSPEREQDFRVTGLAHLVALSGYNVTILCIAVFWVFFWIPKIARILLTIFFLVFFLLFVGGGSSLVRASVMGGIGLFVVHSGRISRGGDALLLASFIMVLIKPAILLSDPSFQLSVAGVLGLLLFSKPLDNVFKKGISNRFWREILVATLAAQIGVFPLLSFLFGEISLIAPLANLLVVPLIPLGMLLSFLTVLGGEIFDIVGNIFGFFAWSLLHICFLVIESLADIPGARIGFGSSKIIVSCISLGGILTYLFWQRKQMMAEKINAKEP
ncbi:ComEC family competence protein [Candidatus Peregrinibacteria bacterium]|nr:MAG: ComEC family competence protein [Candidatus Peregrinibacteria bacterium]